MKRRKKSVEKCIEIPTTRDDALIQIYSVLDDVKDAAHYCHAREVRKCRPSGAKAMSQLRTVIEDRRHHVGILLGIEEDIEMETTTQSALADAY